MNGRPLVSYADITLPYETPEPPSQPPPKKRKKASYQNKAQLNSSGTRNQIAEFEESRQLTHEEIWDDSALISAWNAATEEYEAYHGTDKSWKDQPLTKSALWYNVPPTANTQSFTDEQDAMVKEEEGFEIDADEEERSYGATQEPAVALNGPPAPPQDYASVGPGGSAPMASQDEAFSRALNAMYWGGYWTAVYHCQRRQASSQGSALPAQDVQQEVEENDEEVIAEVQANTDADGDDIGEFISTQR